MRNYGKASEYYNRSLETAKEVNAKDILQIVYESLSVLDTMQRNFRQALLHYRLATQMKDSILNEEKSKQMQELSIRYETEKRENENKLLKQEKETQQLVIYSAVIGIFLLVILSLVMIWAYRNKQKTNLELAEKNQVIEEQNKDITDSIRYAKRIQDALLIPEEVFSTYFSEAFIFFRPRDIVSGDFYWLEKKNGSVLFAAVDCTGHGVPGAFMSIVGYNLLNQIVNEQNISDPPQILNRLCRAVNEILHQRDEGSSVKDGMDIALCSLNISGNTLRFAGAYNPLYRFRNNALQEVKADRIPIGFYLDGADQVFTGQSIQVEKGDMIYIFTDGYRDQFGGDKDAKFKTKRFRELLTGIQHLPAQQQKEKVGHMFEKWKGNSMQIDDILVMGIRI
jgi:serine phosphatase RsbU (regulator of sigma subunit)